MTLTYKPLNLGNTDPIALSIVTHISTGLSARSEASAAEGRTCLSIYMITSVPSVCPGARRGVPVDLARHKGRSRSRVGCTAVACHINNVRRSNIPRTARQRRSWLGEWAATKLGLNMTTAPGPGAGVTGKQQRRYSGWAATALCVCRARQTTHWMSRQIRSGGSSNGQFGRRTAEAIETGRLPPVPNEPSSVRPLPANTLVSGLQTMEQISPRPSRLANLPVYILRDPLSLAAPQPLRCP